MSDKYPIIIMEDRYFGAYSGGKWWGTAGRHSLVDGPDDDDVTCMNFWHENKDAPWIAVGDSPDDVLAKLRKAGE